MYIMFFALSLIHIFKGVNQDRNWIIIILFFDDNNELSFQCSPVHKYMIL